MTRILTGKDYCEISGHAPDAVVCHGISAISQMAGNYLERHGFGTVETGDGFLRFALNGEGCRNEAVRALLDAVYAAFADIREEYPGNIEIIREM